ncbi:MAG: purine-nucleoside phosphorylase [Acidobacteria bacterium]|nr:purine-nucleoside phosphorylase [Acidobacteriota bacterium]
MHRGNASMSYQQAVDTIRQKTSSTPKIAVVLGSGLGAFADSLRNPLAIPYGEIPGWPVSTAIGHAGKLVFGNVGNTEVVLMAGRAHLYEGYTPQQAVFGVRTLGKLGVDKIIFTNAAGGINRNYGQGALVAITDHINLQGSNPLCGPNDDSLGPRFPDMTEAYSRRLLAVALSAAAQEGITLFEGVYAGLLGPSYETPAEIRYLRAIGADLVGMSTVGEVIAANHMGIECLGISCVTNMAAGVLPQKLDHEEVLAVGLQVRDTFMRLLRNVIERM